MECAHKPEWERRREDGTIYCTVCRAILMSEPIPEWRDDWNKETQEWEREFEDTRQGGGDPPKFDGWGRVSNRSRKGIK